MGEDPVVMSLLQKVEVTGHKDRPAFAPRITIRLRGGTVYQGEFQGDELEWDLATETQRISGLFDAMAWPTDQLDSIVHAVSRLEEETSVENLVRLCVRR